MIIKNADDLGEKFLCQFCDESFFHISEEQVKCPKCGTTDDQWLLPLTLQEDEYEPKETK